MMLFVRAKPTLILNGIGAKVLGFMNWILSPTDAFLLVTVLIKDFSLAFCLHFIIYYCYWTNDSGLVYMHAL